MRMTSSERSLRLCAFSVLSARICHATSRVGTTSAVIGLRAEPLHRGQAVATVRRPEPAHLLGRGDGDHGVEEAPGLLDDLGEALVMRFAEVALERRRLDLRDREDREEHRVTAERILVATDDDAAFIRDRTFELLERGIGVRRVDDAAERIEAGRLGLLLARRLAPGRGVRLARGRRARRARGA